MFTQKEIADHLGISRKTVNKNRQMFEGCITLDDCRRAYLEKANHSKINNKKAVQPKKSRIIKEKISTPVSKIREKAIQEEVAKEIFKSTGYIHENLQNLFERLGARLIEAGDDIDISEANDTKIRASSVAIILKGLKDSGRLIDKKRIEDEMKTLFKYYGKLLWEMPKKISPSLVGKSSNEIEKIIMAEHEAMVEEVTKNFDRIMEERFGSVS